MLTDSRFSRRRGRSSVGPNHQRRTDVWRFWLQRALDETPFTLDDFTERLAASYCDLVPEHARRVALTKLSTDMPHREYASEMVRMRKTVQRYMDPDGLDPKADIEEAWVQALPQPYSDECRHALVRRHNCMGIDTLVAESSSDELRAVAEAMSRGADLFHRMSQMMADGHLGPEDIDLAPEAIEAGQDLAAKAMRVVLLIRERVVDAANAESAPTQRTTPLFKAGA